MVSALQFGNDDILDFLIAGSSQKFLFKFPWNQPRSEEHTSELQSPVPISYAVFCLKKKKKKTQKKKQQQQTHINE